jgi:hypothetical protein
MKFPYLSIHFIISKRPMKTGYSVPIDPNALKDIEEGVELLASDLTAAISSYNSLLNSVFHNLTHLDWAKHSFCTSYPTGVAQDVDRFIRLIIC